MIIFKELCILLENLKNNKKTKMDKTEIEVREEEILQLQKEIQPIITQLKTEVESIDFQSFFEKEAIQKCHRIHNLNTDLAFLITRLTCQLELRKFDSKNI